MLVNVDELLSTPPKQIPSLIGSGLLPEHGLMLLVAKTGVGKSVITLDICMSLVLGESLFHARRQRKDSHISEPYFPVNQECKVLYLDAEVGQSGLYGRMKALTSLRCPGIPLGDRFQFVTEHTESLCLMSKTLADKGFRNLQELIRRAKPEGNLPFVVVFDPLGDFHEMDENDSSMRTVIQRIKALQHQFGFAAIIVHHESDRQVQGAFGVVTKTGTAKSRGHSSITASMDTVITLDLESTTGGLGDLRVEWPKVRHGKKPSPGVVLVDYGRMHVEWLGASKGNGLKDRMGKKAVYMEAQGINPEE